MSRQTYRGIVILTQAGGLSWETICDAAECYNGPEATPVLGQRQRTPLYQDGPYNFCPFHFAELEDVDTTVTASAAANTAIAPKKVALRSLVLEAIQATGRQGLTDAELQERLRIDGNTQRPRRRELVQAGKINAAGARANARGRKCTIWVAA